VLIVSKNAKFHSSLTQIDQFTAENVFQSEDHPEDIRLVANNEFEITFFLIFSILNLLKHLLVEIVPAILSPFLRK
jgi:hypothetical protein